MINGSLNTQLNSNIQDTKSKSNAWVSLLGTIQRAVVQEIQVLLYNQYGK